MMTKTERQEKIIEYMRRKNHAVTMDELRGSCGVTRETIRKDLIEMENNHILRRILGGAVLQEEKTERLLLKRFYDNLKEKQEIAAEAKKLVNEKDFICFDSGSTNLCFAKQFSDMNIAILTNSLYVAKEFSRHEHVRIFVAGGELREKNMSMTGACTEKTIRNYCVSKVFLTSEGVDIENGIMDAHESESRVKQAMIAIAKDVYLLVDHTKFSVITPICTAKLQNITAIITDSGTDPEIVKKYRESGFRIIIGGNE